MKEIIVIDSEGRSHNITETALIADYLKLNTIPTIDKLLDWRLRLSEELTKKSYPKGFIDLEIKATDYLLTEKLKEWKKKTE